MSDTLNPMAYRDAVVFAAERVKELAPADGVLGRRDDIYRAVRDAWLDGYHTREHEQKRLRKREE